VPQLVDADGNLVTIDSGDEALSLLTAGSHGFRADTPVRVWTPDGQLGEVDPQDVSGVLSAGYRLAGDTEAQRYDDELTYGDQDVRTFAEGAARGATFGLSDLAFEALGVSKEDLAKRQAVNDTAATIGEVTGVIAPALLTGGSSLLAKGGLSTAAKVATATPAGLVARLGGTAAAAVEGAEAATALGRAAQAARAAAAAGAIEGGLYGAAKQVNEDFLADEEITASRALLGGLLGSATGAAGGALFGGLSSLGTELYASAKNKAAALLGRAIREDGEAVVSGMVPGPRPTMTADDAVAAIRSAPAEQADDLVVDVITNMRPMVPEDAAPLSKVQELMTSARAASGAAAERQQVAVREIRDAGKALFRGVDEVDNVAGVAAKTRVAKKVRWDAPIADIEAVAPVRAMRENLEGVFAEHGAFLQGSSASALKSTIKTAQAAEKQMSAHLAKGEIGEAWIVGDRLKRSLGELQRTRNTVAKKAIRQEYEAYRRHLEDESLWGELAVMQRQINPAWSARIRASDNSFVRRFFAKGGEAADDPFEVLTEINGEAIGPFLKGLNNEESQQAITGLKTYLRALSLDAKTRASVLGSEELAQAASALDAQVLRIEKAIDETALMYRAADAWNDKTWWIEKTGTVTGLLKDLSLAATVTARATRKSAPADIAAALTAARQQADDVARAAYQAAESGERAIQDAGEGLAANVMRSRAKLAVASRVSAETGAVFGVRLSVSDPKSYEKAIGRIDEMRDPDSEPRAELRSKLLPLAEESPQLVSQIEAQVQNTADFLSRKAGTRKGASGEPFDHLKPPLHSKPKAAKLARYARAAEDPKGALERLKRGEVVAEDVETLKALYPRLYARFAARVLEDVTRAERRPSLASQQALQAALGGSPASAVRVGRLQELARSGIGASESREGNGMGPAVTPGNAKPPELAGNMETRNQRLIGGL
jgi:hypothetical protein